MPIKLQNWKVEKKTLPHTDVQILSESRQQWMVIRWRHTQGGDAADEGVRKGNDATGTRVRGRPTPREREEFGTNNVKWSWGHLEGEPLSKMEHIVRTALHNKTLYKT